MKEKKKKNFAKSFTDKLKKEFSIDSPRKREEEKVRSDFDSFDISDSEEGSEEEEEKEDDGNVNNNNINSDGKEGND